MAELSKGQSSETSRTVNRPGVYRHPESGAEVTTVASDGGTLAEGSVQADALVRVGFVWVADAKNREELLKMQQDQLAKEKAEASKDEKKSEK